MDNEIRIFGPPGTGKTTRLCELIKEASVHYRPQEIIVASFTVAASREIASRYVQPDGMHVGTLHSLCLRNLEKAKLVYGDKVIREWNYHWARSAYWYVGVNVLAKEGGFFSAEIMSQEDGCVAISTFLKRNQLVPMEEWSEEERDFHDNWTKFKREYGGFVDFADLIEKSIEIGFNGLYPKIGFFDEVQDFTPLELNLVRKLGQSMDRYYLAGDDDQCIYVFRGAQARAFLVPDVLEENKIILNQSHRLPSEVKLRADRITESIVERQPKEFKPKSEGGLVEAIPYSLETAYELVLYLRRLTQDGETAMVLASCDHYLYSLIGSLRESGIAFHNPYKPDVRSWNPLGGYGKPQWRPALHPKYTSNRKRLVDFLKVFRYKEDGMTLLDLTHEEVWNFMSCVRDDAVPEYETMDGGIDQWRVFAYLATRGVMFPYGKLTREMCSQYFTDRMSQAIMEGDIDYYLSQCREEWKKRFRYIAAIYKKHGLRPLLEDPKIILGTIHSVKGGEADHVLVSPMISPAGQESMERDPDSVHRLFYVAVTRAKKSVKSLWHNRKGWRYPLADVLGL